MKIVNILIIVAPILSSCATESQQPPPQPQQIFAEVIDAVHARSLEGLMNLTDAKTVFLYGYSPGEGGNSSSDTNSYSCAPDKFIREIQWHFQRESVKIATLRENAEENVLVARWLGRNEGGLNVTLEVVFRSHSDGTWTVRRISLREDCTRNK